MSLWRSKVNLEKLRAASQWRDQERVGKDIIQLYTNECKAQRERHRKIFEIQRKARRKDEPNRQLLESQAKAAEIRKHSQKKDGHNVVKLPPIQSQIKVTRRELNNRTGLTEAGQHFLPDIGVNGARRIIPKSVDPSRDPRFQSLISCLLISEEYFGDLQRYAPPRKEVAKQSRVGLGFLKNEKSMKALF